MARGQAVTAPQDHVRAGMASPRMMGREALTDGPTGAEARHTMTTERTNIAGEAGMTMIGLRET